jgi:nitroimidazol reductase NimA-like FMN-containing flavoprotein (pyridoxamine 5'-phosphate oxidase superfamily)
MDLDRHGTEVLARARCLELLRTRRIGRLGLSMGALPVVHPVNFAVDDDRVLIRTGIGSKLSAALRGAVVCLEVDDIDDTGTTGWSVLVTGRAEELVGADAERAAEALGDGSSWAGDHYVGIHIELVSGRRRDAVSPAAPPSARAFPALT